MNLIRTLCPSWRAALLGGVWEGLALPRKSINLKKSSSDLEILLSYDRAHTVQWVHSSAFLREGKPFPDLPRALRAKMNLIRTLYFFLARSAGSGKGLPSPM